MKIKLEEIGMSNKKYTYVGNDGITKRGVPENGFLELQGDETLIIKERLLKPAIIELNKYTSDILIISGTELGVFRGKVIAYVLPIQTEVDIINKY